MSEASANAQNYRGHTTIRAKAIKRAAAAVVGDALSVPADKISVDLHDSESALGLDISTPVPETTVERVTRTKDMNIFGAAYAARESIVRNAERITGHKIGDVRMVLTGIHYKPEPKRRVE